MGTISSKTDDHFKEEFQKRIAQLDTRVVSIATSIDALHKETNQYLQTFPEVDATSGSDAANKCTAIAKDLFDQKSVFLAEISQFAQFMSGFSTLDYKIEGIENYLQDLKSKIDTAEAKKTCDENKNSPGKLGKMNLTPGKDVESKGNDSKKSVAAAAPKSIRRLKALHKEREAIIAELNLREEETQRGIATMQRERQSLENEVDVLKTKLSTQTKHVNDMSREKQKFIAEIASLEDMIEELKRKVEELQEAQIPKMEKLIVQTYVQRQQQLMESIIPELLRHLNKGLRLQNKEVSEQRCSSIKEIQQQRPLIVLHASLNLQANDAAKEIREITVSSKTALIIIHMKEKHALPSAASGGRLTDDIFRPLGGIFDVAYTKEKGIYKCDMNDNPNLMNFLVRASQ